MSLGKPNQTFNVGRRDAFHVPAVLVWSDQHLRAGDAVIFTNRACEKVLLSPITTCHGIVDPWGDAIIMPGYKFWVMLNPGTTSDLRHEFIVTLPEDRAAALRIEAERQKFDALKAADEAKNTAEGHLLVDEFPEDVPDPEGANRCRREGCGFDGE